MQGMVSGVVLIAVFAAVAAAAAAIAVRLFQATRRKPPRGMNG